MPNKNQNEFIRNDAVVFSHIPDNFKQILFKFLFKLNNVKIKLTHKQGVLQKKTLTHKQGVLQKKTTKKLNGFRQTNCPQELLRSGR